MTPRRALVTGASSGIGEATARLLAREGYAVALLARRSVELERLRSSLPQSDLHLVLPCDLRDPEAIAAAFAVAGQRFTGLDLLVNAAGCGYRARVEELEPEPLRQVWETNVAGLLLCCKHALPLLRRGERPVVINLSSVIGRRGVPGQAAYGATKAAVSSIGDALRLEWASEGIAACTLSPGRTRTAFFAVQPNPSNLPDPDLSRAATAGQVARAVLALDRRPRPERVLALRWRLLGALTALAPSLADRLLARRMGGEGPAPRP